MLMPDRLEKALRAVCKHRIIPCISDNVDEDYAIHMLRSGSRAAVYYWLKTGCKESPEEVADYIFNFFGIPPDLV
ncbi:MAG: TetR family transcriptional regulator C-terminal domain-containing protein [Clostridia bacterium]|nr:TetR family transcriptional regulator C-terminal domain-containing protein [Clostridia bacterium]